MIATVGVAGVLLVALLWPVWRLSPELGSGRAR